MNGLAAMKKAGVPDEMIHALASNPDIKVNLTATAFMFIETGSAVVVQVPVTLATLQALAGNQLDDDARDKLRDGLLSAIQLMSNKMGLPSPAGALAKLKPSPGPVPTKPPADKVEKSDSWSVFDSDLLTTAKPVQLRAATKLYQPVRGTSVGSRYFVVAGGKGVRIAARYSANALSIRIEGDDFDKHVEKIKNCGFKVGGTVDYASLHLHKIDNDVIAAKALGAVLLGLGVEIDSPLPDVKKIKGKGS